MAVKVENAYQSHCSQDKFLNDLRTKNEKVQINFVDGKFLIGKVISFDQFTIQLLGKNGMNLAFKSGITSISPAPNREIKSNNKITTNNFRQNIEIPAKPPVPVLVN